jgi:hypothetical protein
MSTHRLWSRMHLVRRFRDAGVDVATVGLVLAFYLYTYGRRTFSRSMVYVGLGLVLVTAVATLAAVFVGPVDRAGRRLRQWFILCVTVLLALTAGTQFYGWGTDFQTVAVEAYLTGVGFIGSSAVVVLLAAGLVIRSAVELETSPRSSDEITQDVLDDDDGASEENG